MGPSLTSITIIFIQFACLILHGEANKRRSVPGWSTWSAFSDCDVSCGIGVKKRSRKCLIYEEGQTDRDPCYGLAMETLKCDTGKKCPVNGKWCSWYVMPHTCTEYCGENGWGIFQRICHCPGPAYNGSDCAPDEELHKIEMNRNWTTNYPLGKFEIDEFMKMRIVEGSTLKIDACNRHYCPYPPYLVDWDEQRIADLKAFGRTKSVKLKRGSTHQLECPKHLTAMKDVFTRERFPLKKAFWCKDSMEWKTSNFESAKPINPMVSNQAYEVEGSTLTIRSFLNERDTGIYRFGFEYEPGKYTTVCFFVVTKIHDPIVMLPDRYKRLSLKCDISNLWPVIKAKYSGTWTFYWLFTDLVDKESKTRLWVRTLAHEDENKQINWREMTPHDFETRYLVTSNQSKSGLYSCSVEHTPLANNGQRTEYHVAEYQIIISDTFRRYIVRCLWANLAYFIAYTSIIFLVVISANVIIVGEVRSIIEAAKQDRTAHDSESEPLMDPDFESATYTSYSTSSDSLS